MTLKSLKILALCTVGLAIVSGAATAQTAVPANFPPSDFTGRQFVDNNGCIFVRAGFDGAVTWVPRVSRQRVHICGQTPTFGGGGTVTAAPVQRPAPAPQQITVETKPAPAPGVRVASPSGNLTLQTGSGSLTTATREPEPEIRRAPASKPAQAQPPRVVRRAPLLVTPMPQQQETVRAVPQLDGEGPCINGSRTRTVAGRSYVSACGVQRAPQVTSVRRSWQDSKAEPEITPQTRIVPRRIYQQQQQVVVNSVPEGYRPAWSDDRLNPWRAYQTVEGYMATQQIWANRTPRKLTSDVWVHRIKEPKIAYVGNTDRYPTPDTVTAAPAWRKPVVSTRSEPTASTARFVQVGLFTTHGKAEAAAARLEAAGLPVRFASETRNGQPMKRVMVGPYASAAALNAGLSATKAAGYVQAWVQ